MDSRRIAKGAELSTAAVVACDEPTDAVGNSGRTRDFILCNLGQLGQQVFVDLLGREPIQTRVRSLGVVPIEVLGDVGASSAHAVVGHEVHAFVLYAAPQPFDKHVVAPGTSPVHRQLDAFAQHRVGKFLGRELTTLIRVDDLRHTVPSEGFLDDLPGMTRLQRDGDFVRQDPATGNVHDRRQVHEAFGHGNVGRVQRPDLVGAIDVQLAQQVGVDLVARSGLAGTRLRRMSARSASLTGLGG